MNTVSHCQSMFRHSHLLSLMITLDHNMFWKASYRFEILVKTCDQMVEKIELFRGHLDFHNLYNREYISWQ